MLQLVAALDFCMVMLVLFVAHLMDLFTLSEWWD